MDIYPNTRQTYRKPPWKGLVHFLMGLGLATLALNLLPYDRTEEMPPVAMPPERIAALNDLSRVPEKDEVRLLFVGASLTAGYPFQPEDRIAYPDLVGDALRELLPGRKVTGRTLAVPALDSPRLLELVGKALPYRPTLLLVCLGANEFSNRIFYGRDLLPGTPLEHLADRGSRGRLVARALQEALSPPTAADALATQERIKNLILQGAPGRPAIGGLPVRPAERKYLVGRMRENMARMDRLCREAGVPLVFLVSPDNTAGAWPWATVTGPKPDGVDEAVARFRAGRDGRLGLLPKVEALLKQAPERADLLFMRATLLLWDFSQLNEAHRTYWRAAAADQAPMRATPRIQDGVSEQAEQMGRPCIFLTGSMLSVDLAGMPDPDLFLDHSHLTLEGHRRAALHLVDRLAETGLLPPLPPQGRTGRDWSRWFADRCTLDDQNRRAAIAAMLWARGNYFLLFGNYRDALPVYLRAFTHGDPANPKQDLELAGSLVFCALKLAGRLTVEGTPEERAARFQRTYRALALARHEGRLAACVEELARGDR